MQEKSDLISRVSDSILLYLRTGVRLPHAVLMNRLQWQWETFPYSSTEKIGVFKTALTFVDSISEIWGPLLTSKLPTRAFSFAQCI